MPHPFRAALASMLPIRRFDSTLDLTGWEAPLTPARPSHDSACAYVRKSFAYHPETPIIYGSFADSDLSRTVLFILPESEGFTEYRGRYTIWQEPSGALYGEW